MSQNFSVADTSATGYGSIPSSPAGGAGNATAGGSGGGKDEYEFEAGPLVFHVDVLILVLIGIVVLLRLPRGLARFWSRSEWTNGHFLGHKNYPREAALRDIAYYNKEIYSEKDKFTSLAVGGSHSSPHRHAGPSSGKNTPSELPIQVVDNIASPPPHVSSCMGVFRSVEVPLRARFVPGFSYGQVLVILLYIACVAYPSFYQSNPFTDPARAGWIAISQAPFVVAFAVKNNLLGGLMGFGYEKLNFLHRFIGRLVVLATNVHAIGYFYKWTTAGTFSNRIARPSNMWGLIGLICFDIIFLFSTDFWRKKAYHLFLTSHIVGFIVSLPALWLHKPSMIPYTIALIVIYGLDRLIRVFKTRFCTARIEPLPELDATRISIRHLNSGWRAGQHVRVRVLSTGMGLLGWSESHPFTIASATGGEDGLVLICKRASGWTRNLKELAETQSYFGGKGIGREVKLLVEGPYGGPGHAIFASYSAALFVCGGSGITFGIAAVQELIRKDLRGESSVKVIELVWVIQDSASLVPFLPTFATMIQQSVYTPLRITVHYTRALVRDPPLSAELFPPGLEMLPGRPNVSKILDNVISRMLNMGRGRRNSDLKKGLLVGVCGPVQLGDSVVRSVGQVEPPKRDEVGGVELHEE
ncbi:hypothetical protein AX16_000811 [Volvariella volvacea WC 439]|nr:hypothetical protein AX16_000811 [Volvariella volvacea WC 439]